ncbi:SPT8-like protein [Podospora appendiculata]|uniref:SPT8-like protein n=1 Tax=Podospora appendiculata TaxID=314037 RepID=A0AAE1CGX4_9PEZI|nr:SPT8-like protein [Podospora appendiculata]
MDDDEREYGSSESEQDELMEDADDMDGDKDADDDNEEEDDDQEDQDEPDPDPDPDPDPEPEPEPEPDNDGDGDHFDDSQAPTADDRVPNRASSAAATSQDARRPSATPSGPLTGSRWRPTLGQEYISASLYDIVPTMAAPQATSVNAMAITPDLRYWITGGSDGYIRKYDGIATINGKQQLTVAQRHPFVDSVTKAGVLLNYWENDEPSLPGARTEDRILSPVYSLAVQNQGLWLLSGLESGGINLQSVRHDEGKKIHCLRDGGHTNAVSVLQLAPDEKSTLSGSWDKSILDWDLNNGRIIRRFDGSGGQISAIELRPANGAPIPAEAGDPEIKSDTLDTNDLKPTRNSFFVADPAEEAGTQGQPAENDTGASADVASPEHESLFGSPGGSLFGDNDTVGGGGGGGGGNTFGNDDDDEFSRDMDMGHGLDHPGAFPMGDPDVSNGPALDPPSAASAHATGNPEADGNTEQADSNEHVSNSEATLNGDVMDMSQPAPETQPPLSASETDRQSHGQLPDAPPSSSQPAHASPTMVFGSNASAAHQDPTQTSSSTFLSAAIDGTIRIWDRRAPDPVARIGNRPGVPPWCMGACWSPDGNWIYAGRRNGTVEEYNIHKARGGWRPERVLKFPAGSGAVSCVRPMVNGRHLVCASHDILRLYDLRENAAFKHSRVPFIIIPGPPRAGVISSLYIDPSSRIMLSAGGTRGWDGTSTEVLIGYEIAVGPH